MPAIFSRLSLWFAAVFAALLVVRAASGGLGLSARALRSLQLCLLLSCRSNTPRWFRSQNRARAVLGAAMALHFGLRHLDGSASAVFFGRNRRPDPARYVLGSRRCFKIGSLELDRLADFGESVTARRPCRPECQLGGDGDDGGRRTRKEDAEDTAEEPSEYRHTRPKKTMRMNEPRQTRGAAAAGASTSSSPGGVAEQNAA